MAGSRIAAMVLLLADGSAAWSSDLYLTAKNTGDRLAKKMSLTFESVAQPDENYPTVMVDPRKTFQTIEGIGGALTDASAETYAKLPQDCQREILTAYFDPEKGIGYSLCRTNIHSCDFSRRISPSPTIRRTASHSSRRPWPRPRRPSSSSRRLGAPWPG